MRDRQRKRAACYRGSRKYETEVPVTTDEGLLFYYLFYCVSSINGQLANRRMYVVSSIRMNNLLLHISQAVMVWNSVYHKSAFLVITLLLFLYKIF